MNRPNRIKFIRFVYWLGALADGAATFAMLWPAELLSVPQSYLSAATRSAFAAGAALMLGWTCLLIWASAEPVARRGILLITMIPVIPGLAASMFYGYQHGTMPLASTAPMWCAQAVIFLLMGIAFRAANREAVATRASTG
jgi:hypothetical protein